MKNQNIFFTLIFVIISLIVGFFGGVYYQRSQRATGFNRLNFQSNNPTGRFMQGTRPINGTIIKKDNESITIKLRDGSTRIVFLNEKTQISKSTSASKEDLTENKSVFIVGQQNPDGSISAENIQINPLRKND